MLLGFFVGILFFPVEDNSTFLKVSSEDVLFLFSSTSFGTKTSTEFESWVHDAAQLSFLSSLLMSSGQSEESHFNKRL